MTQNNAKGVIYYRVSTAEQAERGFSLEHQRDACLRNAESKSVTVAAEFHDDGFSAKTTDRDGLQEMLKFCSIKSNKIAYVIVYKVDRLSRDVSDYSTIKTLLNRLGIQLLSVTENIDDTPAGKFMGNVMATIAQWDNDVRSERVAAGMKKCIESGRWPFKAPVGYLNYINPTGQKEIIVDQQKGKLITFIFNEFAKGLYTEEVIRKKVNMLGLRSHYGKEISPQLIHRILADKFYLGIMTMGGRQYKGSHIPLITVEVFEDCQKQLRKFNKGVNISLSRPDESFPLRHFVRCGSCTRPLTAAFSTGKSGRKFPYYRCYFKSCTSPKSVAKKILEAQFLEYLHKITPSRKYLNAFRSVAIDVWEKKYKQVNLGRETLTNKMEELKQEKQRIVELAKKGIMEDDEAKADLDKVKGKILETEIQLGQISDERFDLKEAIDYCFDFLLHIPEYWQKGTFQQKRRLQSSIFSKSPSYFYPKFETPEFSLIFGQKRDLTSVKSLFVASTGIEPVLPP